MLGDVVGVDGVIDEPLTDKSNLSRQTCLKLYNASRHTDIISTTVSVFRKYVLTQRVFDHQDWSDCKAVRVTPADSHVFLLSSR